VKVSIFYFLFFGERKKREHHYFLLQYSFFLKIISYSNFLEELRSCFDVSLTSTLVADKIIATACGENTEKRDLWLPNTTPQSNGASAVVAAMQLWHG
jgi:hypothetical protein